MVSVESGFLLIAVIIILGFLGTIVFKKTKISDILLLMFLGLLIGPILNILDSNTIGLARDLAPFFASLVLVMLLFESGLKLNFFRVLRELKASIVFTVLVFVLSIGIVSMIMFVLGWNLIEGLMLGAIIGGTSSSIVIPLVNRITTRPETKIMLSLESAFSDALCIIIALALIQIAITTTFSAQEISQDILGAFSIAGVLGALIALFWLNILRDIKMVRERQYILTIAILFGLFFIVEFVNSNGAIAALVFGLVLGNSREIMKFLKMPPISLDTNVSLFQNEISFFIRTFFFIYIGIIFELSMVTDFIIVISIALSLGLLVARTTITKLGVYFLKSEKEDYRLIAIMMPRGLAAAVLASYPLTLGLNAEFAISTVQIVFLVILVTNIITSLGVVFNDRIKKTEEKKFPEKKEGLIEVKMGKKNATKQVS